MIEIQIRPQTVEEAFLYTKNIFRKRNFYRENGYLVDIPKHPVFIGIYNSQIETIEEKENELRKIFFDEIYPKLDFSAGLLRAEQGKLLVIEALKKTEVWRENWGFNLLDKYVVVLTPYGVGGSYSESGMVVFKIDNRRPFANVIVHEIVHIGLEFLVKKFDLNHTEKERLVDLICAAAFDDLLPEYFADKIGELALDSFINKESLLDIPAALKKYISWKSK